MVTFTAIPVIDIGPLVRNSDNPKLDELEDVQEVVKLLDTACRDVGFFYAKGHGLPEALSDAVLSISRKFFDRSIEDKLKIKMINGSGFRGYQRIGENVTKGRPDLHEAIDYYKEFEDDLYGELGRPLCAPNQWPESPADFKSIMLEYVEAMQDLAQKILKGIALGLGGPADAFKCNTVSDPFWVMRVIGYPPYTEAQEALCCDDSGFSCGAHTDYGLLTLVNQDAEPCALQVKNQLGDWIWAPAIPGTFVVNIGDMLQILSNGRYQPTMHRVLNKSSKYRVSVPFFLEPNFDVALKPFEFCKNGAQPDKDLCTLEKPVIYGEHLVKKVLTNFY